MSKFRFKPEDFTPIFGPQPQTKVNVANIANEILNKHLETLTRVYAQKDVVAAWAPWHREHQTHTALIFDVTEIEKKGCDHSVVINLDISNKYVCTKCHKNLIARFEEADE